MIDEIHIPTNSEIEADGFITPPSALERKSEKKAKPIEDCPYPACEKCDHYHGHYCTVPMVVSKQHYRLTADILKGLSMRLDELEKLVTEEIFGSAVRSYTLYDEPQPCHEVKIMPSEETNLTWNDYFKEETE